MTAVAAFFMSNPWRTGFIGLMAALLFLNFWTIPHLKSEITTLTEQVGVDKATIELQNAAVNDWKKQSDEAKKAQTEALATANKAMQKQQSTVTKILQTPVPTPDKECEATLDLMRSFQ